MKKYIIIGITVFFSYNTFAQEDDLMNLFDDEPAVEYVQATFKSSNVILGQSVEAPEKGVLLLNIQHHFGEISSGFYDFFGFDNASTRIGIKYGICNRIAIGLGRSTMKKTWDGNAKVKILRQTKNSSIMPISVSYYGLMGIISLENPDDNRYEYFSSRMSFVNQLIITRKFNSKFSVQLVPSIIHWNLVEKKEDNNDIFSLGISGRIKISNRTSFNYEYHYVFSNPENKKYNTSLSLGIDIDTGGHIFQFFITNSAAITEQYFIPYTEERWLDGDIHIGFNIHRSFTVVKPKEFRD
jgi:hypothetical protein